MTATPGMAVFAFVLSVGVIGPVNVTTFHRTNSLAAQRVRDEANCYCNDNVGWIVAGRFFKIVSAGLRTR